MQNDNEQTSFDQLSPSKKSFKKFLKMGGFENEMELKRID